MSVTDTPTEALVGDLLVVDDTSANLELLGDILGGAGHNVRLAADGELALRSVQAKRPDLILLDVRMPGLDGFEVCRRLKADATTRDIPVIFLSSLTEMVDKAKAFELGAVDYLPKPVAAEEVRARVQNHLVLSKVRERLERLVTARTAALTAEIAQRQQAEEREERINRVLRAIRNVNQLIVREKDPARLVQKACDLLVETRGYRAAWIAQVAESGPLSFLAQSGWGDEFKLLASQLFDGRHPQCWNNARASSTGIALMDPAETCQECPLWQTYGQDQAAVATIRHGGREYGLLGTCFQHGSTADDEEVLLLLEVAGDLGLALFGIESERRRDAYVQIVANSQEAMALIDRNYLFQEVNRSYAKLAGREEAQVAGHHAMEVLGEEFFLRVVKPNIDRCFAGEAVNFETSREIQELGTRFLDTFYSPCFDQDGAVSTVAVCTRDITDRKRAEEAVRETERRLRSTMDSMLEGCQLIGKDWRYLYINAAAEVHNRRPNEELLGNR
jgi:PAS domain S-box-containing protein